MSHSQWLPRPIDATKMYAIQGVPFGSIQTTQNIQNDYLQHMNFNPLMCIVLKKSLQIVCALNVYSYSKPMLMQRV